MTTPQHDSHDDDNALSTELVYPLTRTRMKATPRDKALPVVAAVLEKGESISVCLEPGDGTRYDLLLVPLWSTLINARALGYGIEPDVLRASLLVFNVQDCHKMIGVAIERGGYYGALCESRAYGAAWSVTLLEWWFESHLWPLLDRIRSARDA